MSELFKFINNRPIVKSEKEITINFIPYPFPKVYNLTAEYIRLYQENQSKTLYTKLLPFKGNPDFWLKAKEIIKNLSPDNINHSIFIKVGLFQGIEKAIYYATSKQNSNIQTLITEIDDKIWFGNKDSKKVPYTIERRKIELYPYFLILWDMLIYETIMDRNTYLKSEIIDCIRLFNLYFSEYSKNKVTDEFKKDILLPDIFDLFNPDFLPEAIGGKTPYEESYKNSKNECAHLERTKCYEYENRATPVTKGFIKAIGWGDLKIVKKELIGFQTGEIATIVNVMKNEALDDTLRHLTRQEEVKFDEKETEKEDSKELETNNRFELDREISKTIKEDASMDAGITTSTKYGPENAGSSISGHLDIATSMSKEQSDKEARKMAQEITSRASSKIRERIKSSTTKTTLVETERTKTHGFKPSPDGHNIGVYYFIDKVYRSRVFNYGQRLMLEFMIPQPAAFYIYRMKMMQQKKKDIIKPIHPSEYKHNSITKILKHIVITKDNDIIYLKKETKRDSVEVKRFLLDGGTYYEEYELILNFNGLKSYNDISFENYIEWCELLNVEPLMFPERELYSSSTCDLGNVKEGTTISVNDLKVPEGYYAFQVSFASNQLFNSGGTVSMPYGIFYTWDNGSSSSSIDYFDDKATGTIPYSVRLALALNGNRDNLSISVSVILKSLLLDSTITTWQIAVYNKIMQAYEQKLLEYERKVEQENLGTVVYSNNPNINRMIEMEELKKACISLVTNQKFESFDAMQEGMGPNKYPEFNNIEAWREGKYVQFWEQVFEYDQMMYLFTDYYWSNKDTWIERTALDDNDPLFRKFLQAGYARVSLAVRPGYEKELIYFLTTGKPWIGGSTPTIDSPLFVSIIDQLKESEGQANAVPTDKPWQFTLPTNLVILGAKNIDATCMETDQHPDLPCFKVSRPFVIDRDGEYYKSFDTVIESGKIINFTGILSDDKSENIYGANDILVDAIHIKG